MWVTEVSETQFVISDGHLDNGHLGYVCTTDTREKADKITRALLWLPAVDQLPSQQPSPQLPVGQG